MTFYMLEMRRSKDENGKRSREALIHRAPHIPPYVKGPVYQSREAAEREVRRRKVRLRGRPTAASK